MTTGSEFGAAPVRGEHQARIDGPARADILDAVRRFAAANAEAAFVPGETYIPASGKQAPPAEVRRRRVGPDEIAACVDAALDGWLTAGRFAEQLERDLAKRACPP